MIQQLRLPNGEKSTIADTREIFGSSNVLPTLQDKKQRPKRDKEPITVSQRALLRDLLHSSETATPKSFRRAASKRTRSRSLPRASPSEKPRRRRALSVGHLKSTPSVESCVERHNFQEMLTKTHAIRKGALSHSMLASLQQRCQECGYVVLFSWF